MATADDEGVYAASVPVATGQGDLLACRECGLLKTPMQVRAASHQSMSHLYRSHPRYIPSILGVY